MTRFAALVLLVLAACERGPHEHQVQTREIEPPPTSRRVIEPPVGIVRPLPPHLISTTGVGPYRLGDRMSDLLQQLPTGPRIAVFEVPNILHRSLIRAEEGESVRVGGEPNGTVTFIAVVDEKVARTETGIHVGSSRADLLKASPLVEEPWRAHDPRLVMPQSPRGTRVLFDAKDNVAAIVVSSEAQASPRSTEKDCPRPSATPPAFGVCLTNNGVGEVVEIAGNDVMIRPATGDGNKGANTLRIPASIVFAAPLRIDGRDELAIVTRSEDPERRAWSLITYRADGGKLLRTSNEPLYVMSAANARWIGAELADIDLFLELVATSDTIEVGGLLTTRAGDVVVISPVSIARKRGKPVSSEGSAGSAGSASPPAPDAAAVDPGSDSAPSNP